MMDTPDFSSETALPAVDEQTTISFEPQLSDGHKEEFYEAVYSVAFLPLNSQIGGLDKAITETTNRLDVARRLGDKEEYEALAYNRAALLLLRDLLQIGWKLNLVGPNVQLVQMPLDRDIQKAKEQIRASMNFERQESLQSSAVQDFVRMMERPRQVNGEARTVLSLVADGKDLHEKIASALKVSGDERVQILKGHISPYLQLVEEEEKDKYTGLRLLDIWRYFRLTWSTPYRTTPGRNLFYLVRDASQPCHPIMGIAALANCVIGLKCRDERIGWTPEAMSERVRQAKSEGEDVFKRVTWEIAGLLEKHLETGLSGISITDIATQNTIAFPTEEAIAEIQKIAEQAAEDRTTYLQQEAQLQEEEFELVSPEPFFPREQRESSTALFRRKRASKLAALLQAKLLCQKFDVFNNPPMGLPSLLWYDRNWNIKSESGRSSVRTILNANKESKIGSAMMEVIVCGAIAPYSYLLGGKLVAMLLASPEVLQQYQERYGQSASTIASQIAGRDVTRSAHLVYLGTSSLYAGAIDKEKFEKFQEGTRRASSASQYNRVRIPAHIAGRKGEINYDCIGVTKGFGVVHFSSDTREALEELDRIKYQGRRVNSIFGEGTSPRMRKIRQGISLLGLDERFLVHGQSRIVYGVKLAYNTERYLNGEDEDPNYILPLDNPKATTNAISSYWIERWLSSRLNHEETLRKVANFRSFQTAVSKEYSARADEEPTELKLWSER